MVRFPEHALLDPFVLTCTLPAPLGGLCSNEALLAGLSPEADTPLSTDDEVKGAVRRLLRLGGFKPSGRNKPASEYLIKAAEGGFLGPINVLVDACNVVSLHSGLPISVVDLDRVEGSLSVGIAEGSYLFNAAGQELRLDGLICLRDEAGWCANAVKDSQRTKTHEGTTRALYLLWGSRELPGRAAQAGQWLRRLLAEAEVECATPGAGTLLE